MLPPTIVYQISLEDLPEIALPLQPNEVQALPFQWFPEEAHTSFGPVPHNPPVVATKREVLVVSLQKLPFQ